MKQWYPEFISDTRYLSPGRTTFHEQYQAGKNLVVQELIRLDKIKDEHQIIDISEVEMAAVHATAYCILNGIPKPSEAVVERKDAIWKDFQFWVNRSRFSLDVDEDGIVDETEERISTQFFARR